jgi:hypothetical protein
MTIRHRMFESASKSWEEREGGGGLFISTCLRNTAVRPGEAIR